MARSEMRVGVLVYDFRAAVAQSGRKLRVRVVVGAASTADASRRIVVRAGRCTSGQLTTSSTVRSSSAARRRAWVST
jgi:hypothetical protein